MKRRASGAHRSRWRRSLGTVLLGFAVSMLPGCGYLLPAGALALIFNSSSKKGSVIVITDPSATIVVSRGPFDVGDSTEGKGLASLVLTQVRLTPTKDTTLRSLTFAAGGTGDATAITSVRLYQDVDSSGVLDASAIQIGSPTQFSGPEKTASFPGLNLSLKGGTSVDFLVVIDTPASAKDGDTFSVSIAQAAAVDAFVTSSGAEATILGLPFESGTKTISSTGTLRVFVGPSSPGSQSVFPATAGVRVLQIELRTSSVEAVRVSKLVLNTSGTGNDAVDIARASLYVDVDGDGRVTPGQDLPIGTSAPQADNGPIVFDGLGVVVPANGSVQLLLTYDLNPTTVDGATFQAGLLNATDLLAQGVTSGQPIAPTGTPLESATITITPAASIQVSQSVTLGGAVAPGQTNVGMLALRLLETSGKGAVTLTSLTVTASGTGNDATDILQAKLWREEQPPDGAVTAADTEIGLTKYFSDNGVAAFGGLSETIPANGELDLLVTYDMAGPAVVMAGSTYAASVQVGGMSLVTHGSVVVVAQGLPQQGAARIVGTSVLTVATGANDPSGTANVRNKQTGFPMLQLALSANSFQDVGFNQLAITSTGTGNAQTGVATVTLVRDVNGNGVYDAGDVVVGTFTSPFVGSKATLSGFSEVVPKGTTVNYLVLFDLGNGTLANNTFNATVASAGDVGATATVSGTFPISAGKTLNVVGGVTIALGPNNPAGRTTATPESNVVSMQLQITADAAENMTLSSVTFTTAGSANDATTFSSGTLVRDTNGNGVIDGGDVTLATVTPPFTVDNGTVAFGGLGQTITAGTTIQLIFALSVQAAPPSVKGLNFRESVALNSDVSVTGVVSGSTLASGAAVTGNTFTTGVASTVFGAPAAQAVATSGVTVVDLATGDFDGDGNTDFIALLSNGQFEVHFGNGDGTFKASVGVWPASAPGVTPLRVLVADMAKHGYLDVVVLYPTSITIFKNGASASPGTFASSTSTTSLLSSFQDMAIVDYNRDGNLDVVALDGKPLGPGLFGRRGDGAGGFTGLLADTLSTPSAPERMAVADYNLDGIQDVVFTDSGGNVRLATGNGTFFTLADVQTAGTTPMSIASTDLNRDGASDAVLVDQGASNLLTFKGNPSTATLSLGSSNPTSPALTAPRGIVLGDWNGDGIPDIAIAHAGSGSDGIQVYLGDGTFTFPSASGSVYATGLGIQPTVVVSADFNHDGVPDLLCASSTVSGGSVYLLLGQIKSGATGSVSSGTVHSWDQQPFAVGVADFNLDGQPDFILAGQNRVAVYLNNGNATSFTQLADIQISQNVFALKVVDANRDGKPDVVMVAQGGGIGLIYLQGNGDGTFQTPVNVNALKDNHGVALDVGDLNGDGIPDAAVAEHDSNTIQIYRGTGTGFANAVAGDQYSANPSFNGDNPVDIAVRDLNRDGKLDVVVLCQKSRTIQVRLGNGDDTLGSPIQTSLSGTYTPSAMALGDLNQDGILDLVVVSSDTTVLEIFKGNGDGTFTSQGTKATGTTAKAVALGDVNRDGTIDIVVARGDSAGSITVFPNVTPSTFTFGLGSTQAASSQVSAIVLGDVNRDGLLDVVAAEMNQHQAEVFLGE